MKKQWKRFIAALLSVSLMPVLEACKDNKDDSGTAFQVSAYYTAEELDLPVPPGKLHGCCAMGEDIYLWITREKEETERLALYQVNLGNNTIKELEQYAPAAVEGDPLVSFWGPFPGGDGKLWLGERYVAAHDDLPAGLAGSGGVYYLRQLDPGTGRELKAVDVSSTVAEMKGEGSLRGLTVDRQGIIYMIGIGKMIAQSDEGEVLFTLKAQTAEDMDDTLALLPDGTAIALVDTMDQGREVRTIDPSAGDWGETRYSVSNGTWGLVGGSGPCHFFSQRNNTLYGRLEGEELDTRLLNWEDAGLGTGDSVMCFTLLEDGRVATLTRSVPAGGALQDAQLDLRMLVPAGRPPYDGKVRLVYGTIGDDGWARRRVNEFNKNNDKYYIEIRDYAEGMLDYTGTNYIQVRDAAVTRLMAAIIKGEIPDILDDRNIPLVALARQDVLEDLWPYIDNDPELGREAVMSHVLECSETNGKLCQVFSNFRIETLVASRTAASDQKSWTLEGMLSAYDGTMPDVYDTLPMSARPSLFRVSADELLFLLIRMNLNNWVDWSTGECHFDTEEFRNVLRLCSGVTQEDVAGAVSPALWDGQPAVYQRCLGSMGDLAVDDAIFGGPKALMDYEAQMAANGITAYQTEIDGEWTGVVDEWLGDAERARESGVLFDRYPVAADFVTGALEHTGYAAYIGFPTNNNSGSCFRVSDCLAITADCVDKAGAWQFVRQLLLPDGNLADVHANLTVTYDAFPVNKADFENLLEPQYFTDDNGEYVLDQDGEQIEKAVSVFGLGDPTAMLVFLRSPTREQVNRFYALYNSTDHIMGEDSVLTSIIYEEAQSYFAGDRGVDEVVELIQRRAMLCVGENL